ncbi:MAG: (2Fe-2S)-binding protein [Treponema sp.]|jgi:iron only hydrogenase large subunit-like protein|nr:(2Fe-2S)-binding protein [Treponema sp.]
MSHYKPDPNKNVNLIIDGLPVSVPEGTTILEAARKINVTIPTLCDYPELGRRAICRLCVVECDGRSKLVAACANDVWEGVNIVTNNIRILNIRKTIVELLLANHPQDCLVCVRSGKCELQKLAADLGIREQAFCREEENQKPPLKDSETLVRDMGKCVKCGRCVEVCQEIQSVRAINTACRSVNYEICAPYGQALSEGPCVFCGQCAAVCPVGAIYEYDQTAEVRAALNDNGQNVAVQIASQTGAALETEFGLPSGSITTGKLVSALKRLGFDKVFDAGVFADMARAEISGEILTRIKNKSKLPLINCCSQGSINFVKNFFPELAGHLSTCKNPRNVFGDLVKNLDSSRFTGISVSCIAHKFEARQSGTIDVALTTRELGRMIKLSGIDFKTLPESPFDSIMGNSPASETFKAVNFKEADRGIIEAEYSLQGTTIKALAANGLANARKIMDSIKVGECKADIVEIMSCSNGRKADGCDCGGLFISKFRAEQL